MKPRTKSIALWATAAIAALLVAQTAIATIPGSDGQIVGCYSRRGGALRLIDREAGARCKATERRIVWNQTGARGATGPTGPSGSGGETGSIVVKWSRTDLVIPSVEDDGYLEISDTIDWTAGADDAIDQVIIAMSVTNPEACLDSEGLPGEDPFVGVLLGLDDFPIGFDPESGGPRAWATLSTGAGSVPGETYTATAGTAFVRRARDVGPIYVMSTLGDQIRRDHSLGIWLRNFCRGGSITVNWLQVYVVEVSA